MTPNKDNPPDGGKSAAASGSGQVQKSSSISITGPGTNSAPSLGNTGKPTGTTRFEINKETISLTSERMSAERNLRSAITEIETVSRKQNLVLEKAKALVGEPKAPEAEIKPAKRYAKSTAYSKTKKSPLSSLKIKDVRTYELREMPPYGFSTWAAQKFPHVKQITPTVVFIEGNYKTMLQLGWPDYEKLMDTDAEDNRKAAEAAKREFEEAKVLTVRIGNWEIDVTALTDVDSKGGVRHRETKTIIIDHFPAAWGEHNGPEVLREALKEYLELPKEFEITSIEDNNYFLGRVSINVEKFIKIPINYVEIAYIYFDDKDEKFKLSDVSKMQLRVKCGGVDKTPGANLEYVRPPKRCNICKSLDHLVDKCPSKKRGPRLYKCENCHRSGTCTFDECSHANNIKDGDFSNVRSNTVTYAKDPFNKVPKKNNKGKKKSGYVPRVPPLNQPQINPGAGPSSVSDYPGLVKKTDQNGRDFWIMADQSLIGEAERKAKEAEEKKRNKNTSLSKSAKRKSTSNRFVNLVNHPESVIELIDDEENEQVTAGNDIVVLHNRSKKSRHPSEREKARHNSGLSEVSNNPLDFPVENEESSVGENEEQKEDRIIDEEIDNLRQINLNSPTRSVPNTEDEESDQDEDPDPKISTNDLAAQTKVSGKSSGSSKSSASPTSGNSSQSRK